MRDWYGAQVKPPLGPLPSLLLATLFAVVGSGHTWFTLDTQHVP